MADADVAVLSPPKSASPALKKKAITKKSGKNATGKSDKSTPTHPPTAEMVVNAIKTLKERGGSSLPAIKKYLASTYKVDPEKMAPFIRKFLKNAVASGKLIQTKGKGASGSFKLPVAVKKEAVKPKKVKPEKSSEKKTKPTTAKKSAVKKAKSESKKSASKPAGEKKTVKPKAAKPKSVAKSPKPKKSKPVLVKKAKSPKK